MVAHEPMRPTATRLVVACLALALAVAACSAANPSVSPSASVSGSSGAAPSASQAPTVSLAPSASPSPSAEATPSSEPVRASAALPATAAPAAAAPSPAIATKPQTIHLVLHPGNDTEVSVGSLSGCTSTPCQGDYRLGDDALFDATTGLHVGTLVYVEFRVAHDSLFHSPANTITLDGRGQIVFTETLYDDGSGREATGAVIGGTGEFLGAMGYVISKSLGGSGDFVVTITK